jgi:hypothetical protein
MLSSLLRDLVGEFTLADNPSNTTTSLLRTMCHTDDSIILGAWLQETDQKAIEDQVRTDHVQVTFSDRCCVDVVCVCLFLASIPIVPLQWKS